MDADLQEEQELNDELEIAGLSERIKNIAGQSKVEIMLSRQKRGEPKPVHLITLQPDQFDLEYIRLTFGGGSYKARVVDARTKKVKDNLSFDIDDMWPGQQGSPGKTITAGDPLANLPEVLRVALQNRMQGGNDTLPLMMQMMQMQMQMQTESQKTMMLCMTEMFKASGGRKEMDINSVLLENVLRNSSGGNLTEMLKVVKELHGLSPDRQEDKPGMIEQLLPLLTGMLGPVVASRMIAAGSSPAQSAPPARVTVDSPAAPPAGPPSLDKMPLADQQELLRGMIRQNWHLLWSGALEQSDTISFANVLETVCGHDFPVVQTLLRRDDWHSLFPAEMKNQLAWFTELRNQLTDDAPVADGGNN